MDRRAEIQRSMTIRQIAEVDRLITQIRDAMDVAELCETSIVVIGWNTAAKTTRNLEDLKKRFLMGLTQEA